MRTWRTIRNLIGVTALAVITLRCGWSFSLTTEGFHAVRGRGRLLHAVVASLLCVLLSMLVLATISAQGLPGTSGDDDPAIEVWFEEGCDRTYAIGDYLHLRYRSNVDAMARVWRYPDEELFMQQWMAAGVIYEIDGPVTGPAGEWWVLGELLESGATAMCYYTTTVASATPIATATISATETATATSPAQTPGATATITQGTPTVSATGSATSPATGTAEATPTATATATASATAEATPTATATATASATAEATPSATRAPASPSPRPSAQVSATPQGGYTVWLPWLARGLDSR